MGHRPSVVNKTTLTTAPNALLTDPGSVALASRMGIDLDSELLPERLQGDRQNQLELVEPVLASQDPS